MCGQNLLILEGELRKLILLQDTAGRPLQWRCGQNLPNRGQNLPMCGQNLPDEPTSRIGYSCGVQWERA